MFTVKNFDPKTNELTVTYKLSKPTKSKVMYMVGTTGGFADLPGVMIEGAQVRISTNIGFKK